MHTINLNQPPEEIDTLTRTITIVLKIKFIVKNLTRKKGWQNGSSGGVPA
jgi:hypothetical protein